MTEELKAIDFLRAKTISYESDAKELHYSLILYNLIINLQQENQKYKEVIDKAIKLLGNYKHYSTPDEKQNSDNEDLANKVFDVLKEVK